MPHYKTAFIHIQCKTATAVGSKTIKIRLYLFQIFLCGFLSANQLWFKEICQGEIHSALKSKEQVLRRFNPDLHLLFNFFALPNTRIKIIPLLLKKLAQICRGERTKLTDRFSIEISHSYHEIMNLGSLLVGTNGFRYTVFYVGLHFLCNLCNVIKYKLVFVFCVTCAMSSSIIKIHCNF